MTARRPGARTEKAYQTFSATGPLDKRPAALYYAAVAHGNAVSAQDKERSMTTDVELARGERGARRGGAQPIPQQTARTNGMP